MLQLTDNLRTNVLLNKELRWKNSHVTQTLDFKFAIAFEVAHWNREFRAQILKYGKIIRGTLLLGRSNRIEPKSSDQPPSNIVARQTQTCMHVKTIEK